MNDDDDGDGDGDGDRVSDGVVDARVQGAVDHLQRAARELIAASRALLDVAEELVDDPQAVGSALGVLGSLADSARRATMGRSPSRSPHDDDEDPGVQRIPVS